MHETETMKKALSEFSQNVRSQTRTINIKVTFISWMVEFVTGITFLLFTVFGNQRFRPYYTLFYVTSMGVAVPLTYIINRDVTKEKILIKGWQYGIRSIFIADTQIGPNEGPNVLPVRNLSSEPKRPQPSNSIAVNNMPTNTSKTTVHSAQKIDPIPVGRDPQINVLTHIPPHTSNIIQPIILPLISGNTCHNIQNN